MPLFHPQNQRQQAPQVIVPIRLPVEVLVENPVHRGPAKESAVFYGAFAERVQQRDRKNPGVWWCWFQEISGKLLKWQNFINSEWCFGM